MTIVIADSLFNFSTIVLYNTIIVFQSICIYLSLILQCSQHSSPKAKFNFFAAFELSTLFLVFFLRFASCRHQ